MRGLVKSLFLALTILLGAVAMAGAQSMPPDKFAEALKRYDPDTVAVARAYAQTFNMRAQLAKSAPALAAAVAAQLKGKNPGLNDEQVKLFVDTYMKIALVDNAPVLEQATILTMLDIFNKDELTALNQFYSSAVGAEILKKFPLMMARMPQVMRLMQSYILPRALDGAREALKARGVEVKT
jgi:hypothetical protein